MNKNRNIIVSVLIIIILGFFIYYFVFQAKSPTVSPPLTEAEERQALIDSTTSPKTSTIENEKERQQLIDSTTAPNIKTTINN